GEIIDGIGAIDPTPSRGAGGQVNERPRVPAVRRQTTVVVLGTKVNQVGIPRVEIEGRADVDAVVAVVGPLQGHALVSGGSDDVARPDAPGRVRVGRMPDADG